MGRPLAATINLSDNGQLSLTSGSSSALFQQFGANVDLRGTRQGLVNRVFIGNLTNDATSLAVLRGFLAPVLSSAATFVPTALLVVSWVNVGYYSQKVDKVNNFQFAIATNGTYVKRHARTARQGACAPSLILRNAWVRVNFILQVDVRLLHLS